MRNPKEYVESEEHLPDIMRDFHNAKEVFKTIEFIQGRCKANGNDISWADAMIYTIDHFLWFIAQYGYTLQRSRAKVDFKDLDEGIAKLREAEVNSLKAMLGAAKKHLGE